MSATVETIVACDLCGENNGADDRGLPAKEIRRNRRDSGWVTIGRYDFCPDCKEEGRRQYRAARQPTPPAVSGECLPVAKG